MRTVQPTGTKGSLKWMQRTVNGQPVCLHPPALPQLCWVSPLANDGFSEYRDAAFLEKLGLSRLARDLSEFWPSRGPQWDGLATFSGGVVLAEAKAQLSEFSNSPSAAGPASAARIHTAFDLVQDALGVTPKSCWMRTHYQYANRLAHLWWLRARGINAHLLLVAFLNDPDWPRPADRGDWQSAFADADRLLGLSPNPLAAFVHHVFPDTRDL